MSAPNPSTALAGVVVDELARNGVRHVVLAPGSRSAALALAALESEAIAVHVEIDERSAGFLALGIAKAGDGPAAVITTSGTAAANLGPAVVESDMAGIPLLIITADRPPELRHAGANQTIDQVKLFGDRVRWFCEMGIAEDVQGANGYWRSTVCRAVSESLAPRPGPVHLNLSFREPLVPLSDDGRVVAAPFAGSVAGRADGSPWTRVRREVAVTGTSTPLSGRVLVVAGDGAGPISERPWPVIAEAHSGGRREGTISTAHHLLAHGAFFETHIPDVVVTIGRVGLSGNVARLIGRAPRKVVVDPSGWADPDRAADEIVATLPVPGGVDADWSSEWLSSERLARDALDRFLDELSTPTEPRVARDTAAAVPDHGALFVASSMPVRDLDWFMRPKPIRVISNRGASGIDGFVSSVLGAAIGAGPVVGLGGDLSLLHDQNGFLLDRRPDCVFVVVNNDGGGIFSFLPQAGFPDHFERGFGTPHGRSMEILARFHALAYERIEEAGGLEPAISKALSAGGIHLIEVETDRTSNVSIHRDATAAVVSALR